MKIKNITKHPNADTLSIAEFEDLLWACIIKNDEFKVGDLAIYIPVDSIVPESLIQKYNIGYLKNGERVRAVKLRGSLSYGFIVPNDLNAPLGGDLAAKLGVTKWEPPPVREPGVKTGGRLRKQNSNFAKYTDIENINNYPNVFKDDELVIATEKIHGMSFRAGWVRKDPRNLWDRIKAIFAPYEFIVGSHNCQLDYNSKSVFVETAKKLGLKEKTKHLKGYVFYGELYGKGVQKGMEYDLNDVDIRFFDIKYEDNYLDYAMMKDTVALLGFDSVPLIDAAPFDLARVKALATGESTLASHKKEGVVIKPIKERYDHKCGRVILKVINPDYLLDKEMTDFH